MVQVIDHPESSARSAQEHRVSPIHIHISQYSNTGMYWSWLQIYSIWGIEYLSNHRFTDSIISTPSKVIWSGVPASCLGFLSCRWRSCPAASATRPAQGLDQLPLKLPRQFPLWTWPPGRPRQHPLVPAAGKRHRAAMAAEELCEGLSDEARDGRWVPVQCGRGGLKRGTTITAAARPADLPQHIPEPGFHSGLPPPGITQSPAGLEIGTSSRCPAADHYDADAAALSAQPAYADLVA